MCWVWLLDIGVLGGLFLKYFGSGKYNLYYWVIGPVLRDMGLNVKLYNSLKLQVMYENDDKGDGYRSMKYVHKRKWAMRYKLNKHMI